MDTGSSNLWVIDCACRGPNCTGTPDSGYKKRCLQVAGIVVLRSKLRAVFHPARRGLRQRLSWSGRRQLRWRRLADLVQTFGIATTVFDDFAQHPVDGVLGLGWSSIFDDHVQPPVFQILKERDKPLFTICLERETGAEYNFIYGVCTVACDAKLPDIVPTIGSKKYNIPPSEYVLDLGIGGGQCAIAAGDGGETSPFDQPSIILGDVFLRAYCNIYDIGQKRIGFAKAHHKEF